MTIIWVHPAARPRWGKPVRLERARRRKPRRRRRNPAAAWSSSAMRRGHGLLRQPVPIARFSGRQISMRNRRSPSACTRCTTPPRSSSSIGANRCLSGQRDAAGFRLTCSEYQWVVNSVLLIVSTLQTSVLHLSCRSIVRLLHGVHEHRQATAVAE